MRVKSNIRKALQAASLEQIKKWWLGDRPDWIESSIEFHYALKKRLWAQPEGIQFLKHYARYGKGQRRGKALLDLSNKKIVDEEIIQLLTKAFNSPIPSNKYSALVGLRYVKKFTLKRHQVEVLLKTHEKGWERDLGGQAFLYLVNAFPKEALQILSNGLENPNSSIRMHASYEIWHRELFELVPKVKHLIKDDNWHVAVAARDSIDMLQIKKLSKK